MKADGSVIIDTKMNNGALEKGFERLKTDCETLGITCEKVGDKIKAAFADYDVSANIQNAVAKLEQAQNKLQTATDYFNDAVAMGDDKSAEAWARKRETAYDQVEAAQRRLTQVIAAEAEKQRAAEERAAKKSATAHEKAAAKAATEREKTAQKKAASAEKETAKEKKESKKQESYATKSAKRFGKRFSRIISGALIFNIISSTLKKITSYFGNVLKSNTELYNSWRELKGTLLTLFQPLIDVIGPALTKLVRYLNDAVKAAIQLVAAITGKTASELSKEAQSAYELAQAMEDTEAAAKSLAGFDELNVISNKDDTSAIFPEYSDETPAWIENLGDVLEQAKEKFYEYAQNYKPSADAWSDAFGDIAPVASETATEVKNDLLKLKDRTLKPFAEYLLTEFAPSVTNSFSEAFAPIYTDMAIVALENFQTDSENTTALIDECFSRLQDTFEKTDQAFDDMCDSVTENWEKYGDSIAEGAVEAEKNIWETIWGMYDDIISPVLDNIEDKLSALWDEHLKPLWDNIVEFVMSFIDNILALWNGFLKPLIMWLIDVVGPVVKTVLNAIVDALSVVIGIIADLLSSILKLLDGVITFIVGVFTLDWERAWEGIKKIFSGVWNAIVSILKGVVNIIIWILNTLVGIVYTAVAGIVNGLGDIVSTVGSWFGADWGFSIPTTPPAIPYLAEGAVLPANQPFLAMVGDQKHGTNVEAPLTTIQEAVALVVEDMTNGMMAGFEALLEENQRLRAAVEGIEVGDSTIGQAANRYNQRMAIIRG